MGGALEEKPHLVKSLTICKDKKEGLGIKELSIFKKAFLGTWFWRFTLGKDMLVDKGQSG